MAAPTMPHMVYQSVVERGTPAVVCLVVGHGRGRRSDRDLPRYVCCIGRSAPPSAAPTMPCMVYQSVVERGTPAVVCLVVGHGPGRRSDRDLPRYVCCIGRSAPPMAAPTMPCMVYQSVVERGIAAVARLVVGHGRGRRSDRDLPRYVCCIGRSAPPMAAPTMPCMVYQSVVERGIAAVARLVVGHGRGRRSDRDLPRYVCCIGRSAPPMAAPTMPYMVYKSVAFRLSARIFGRRSLMA